MPAYFYILFSSTRDRYYIGYTGSTLELRLRKHNTKHKGFTGSNNDWSVVYAEEYATPEEARKREKQVKSWKSRKDIESLIGSA